MKTLISIITLVTLVSAAQVTSVFKLNGNVNDSCNNRTMYVGTYSPHQYVEGRFGQAINGWISVNNFNIYQFSASLWINVINDSANFMELGSIYVSVRNNRMYVQSLKYSYPECDFPIQSGWNHIVIAYDDRSFQHSYLYVNTILHELSIPNDWLYRGITCGSSIVDELRIYENIELVQADVDLLFNPPTSVKTTRQPYTISKKTNDIRQFNLMGQIIKPTLKPITITVKGLR